MNKAHGNRFVPIDAIQWEVVTNLPLHLTGTFQGTVLFTITQECNGALVFIKFKTLAHECFASVEEAKKWANNFI